MSASVATCPIVPDAIYCRSVQSQDWRQNSENLAVSDSNKNA